jgi:quercetin 2,3-dioxygenase
LQYIYSVINQNQLIIVKYGIQDLPREHGIIESKSVINPVIRQCPSPPLQRWMRPVGGSNRFLKRKVMENNLKIIESIIPPPPPHMVGNGFRVHNFFPTYGESRMSPFFLLDYNSPHYFPPSEIPPGVGPHPHRGMETVTIAYQGSVEHHDSMGNSGIIHEGDVQWMTAGSGILHKEYHSKEFSQKGGMFHMVQLWVNLKKQDKMILPAYQALENHKLAKYRFEKGKAHADIIAGELKGVKGPASTYSPINLFNLHINAGGNIDFQLPENHNSGMIVIKGEIKVNRSELVKADHFILFQNSGEKIIIDASQDSIVLVMSGEPINEPIVAQGPFLMNTAAEIKQTYEDYYNGAFGFLED